MSADVKVIVKKSSQKNLSADCPDGRLSADSWTTDNRQVLPYTQTTRQQPVGNLSVICRPTVNRQSGDRFSRELFFTITNVLALPATEACGYEPVLISINEPVPMVQLTSPTSKQHCPNTAACWSAT